MTDFTTLHSQGMGRDQMIVAAVQDGMSLNKATRAYQAWAKENGLVKTLTSHKAEALKYLDEYYSPVDVEPSYIKAYVVELAEKFSIAESTARDYIKAWFEDAGVEMPQLNPRQAMFAWLIEHDGEDVADMKAGFKEYAKNELNRSDSNINEYWKGYELHLALVAAKS